MVRKNNYFKTILIAVGMSLSILVLCLSCGQDKNNQTWAEGYASMFGITEYRDVELGTDILELKQRFSHFKKQPFTAAYPDIYFYTAKRANRGEGIENWDFGFTRVGNSLKLMMLVVKYDSPRRSKDWKQLVEIYTKKYGKPDTRRRHEAIWNKPLDPIGYNDGAGSEFAIRFRPKDGTLGVSLVLYFDNE